LKEDQIKIDSNKAIVLMHCDYAATYLVNQSQILAFKGELPPDNMVSSDHGKN